METKMVLPTVILSEDANYLPTKKSDKIPFSEALDLTKFGKFNYFLIFTSGLVLGSALLETASMGFILPFAQCDLQLSNLDKGILSAVGYGGSILSLYLWGFLADTKGRHRIIKPTLIAGFIATLLSSVSYNFWMLVVLRFINGFFVSGSSATIYAYLGEFHTDKTRSRAMMGFSFIYSIVSMLLPVIAYALNNQDWALSIPFLGIVYKPWRLLLLACGLPGGIAGVCMYFLPESPKYLLSLGKEAETIEVLQKVNLWNGGTEPLKITHIEPELNEVLSLSNDETSNSNVVVTFIQSIWQQTTPLFYRKYLRTTLTICGINFWLFVVVSGMYLWFPHVLNSMMEFVNQHHGETTTICKIVEDKHESLYKTDGTIECVAKFENTTYFYSMFTEAMFVLTFALCGLVVNRVGKISLLFVTIMFFTFCGLASALVTEPSIAACLYGSFFLVCVANNILSACAVELYPTNLRAMAICIMSIFGRIGSAAGANIVSAVIGTNCDWTFYISCGTLFMCGFMSLLIPRKTMDEVAKKTADMEM